MSEISRKHLKSIPPPYTLHAVNGAFIVDPDAYSKTYSIRDRKTGKTVGYVKKVENGYWRARGAEGDTNPTFTKKTRKAAVARLWEALEAAAILKKYPSLAKLTELDEAYDEKAAADAERAFELEAAFGPGAKVVNIVTGERYRT